MIEGWNDSCSNVYLIRYLLINVIKITECFKLFGYFFRKGNAENIICISKLIILKGQNSEKPNNIIGLGKSGHTFCWA